jgi:hypothetical protein
VAEDDLKLQGILVSARSVPMASSNEPAEGVFYSINSERKLPLAKIFFDASSRELV